MRHSDLVKSVSGNIGTQLLHVLNYALLLGACAAVVYTVQQYRTLAQGSGREEPIDVSIPDRSSKPIKPAMKTVQPLAQYLASLKNRDLFEAPWEKQKDVVLQETPVVEDARYVMEFTQSVRLVGIIRDENPKVVIEDLINRETLFISVGDQIRGATLEEIFGEKVHFSIGGETVELYP